MLAKGKNGRKKLHGRRTAVERTGRKGRFANNPEVASFVDWIFPQITLALVEMPCREVLERGCLKTKLFLMTTTWRQREAKILFVVP